NDSLKVFLEKRGMSKEGTKSELAALCFAVNKLNIQPKPTSQQILTANKKAYTDLLSVKSDIITDPFKISSGWFGEHDGMRYWPPVFLSDITRFFIQTTDDPKTETFLGSYKTGRSYEYFTSSWMKEVHYHPLSNKSKFCLLRSQCTPSQRVSDTDHGVWTCIEKTSGAIMCAYCSCTAGLGQTCNHIAGLLYRVEHANKIGLCDAACTSLPCT
ncbi:uncharacterized protein, partial [Argopecten irradians]|uniref:uncharacterized protein n=1 Tax=Argopecten irradians TaxID=31199 RepID=UPI003721218F